MITSAEVSCVLRAIKAPAARSTLLFEFHTYSCPYRSTSPTHIATGNTLRITLKGESCLAHLPRLSHGPLLCSANDILVDWNRQQSLLTPFVRLIHKEEHTSAGRRAGTFRIQASVGQ